MALVEDCMMLDVTELANTKPGEWKEITRRQHYLLGNTRLLAVVGWQRKGDTIDLVITRPDGRTHAEEIPLTFTPCNFGWFRPWLLCPECQQRIGKLYLPPNEIRFLCRKCHGLKYTSCHESGNRLKKLERQIKHLQAKLGASKASAFDSIPPRPKYMRRRTYVRIAKELFDLKRSYETASASSVKRLTDKEIELPHLSDDVWFLLDVPPDVRQAILNDSA